MAAPERPDREPERDRRTGRSAAAARIQHQASWVELQLQQAAARGDFDDLPGYGKPIPDLGGAHDPDWWLKRLIEREQVTGVLPPALQLRKDDAELDARLDALARESDCRREVEEFNQRVLAARYQPLGGPPLITQPRDLEAEVAAWRQRRRPVAPPASVAAQPVDEPPTRRRWWRRSR